ncbi:MAG: nucleotidyltransferase domain-containing protein [Steroidobacteraceae bacterium]
MKYLDPDTEAAVRNFLSRIPADLRIERAILYGSRARGEHKPDSDADVALIVADRDDVWQILWMLGGIAFDVFMDTDILIQPVVITLNDWLHPERAVRPGFLRNSRTKISIVPLTDLMTPCLIWRGEIDAKSATVRSGADVPQFSLEEERRQARENWLRLRQQQVQSARTVEPRRRSVES